MVCISVVWFLKAIDKGNTVFLILKTNEGVLEKSSLVQKIMCCFEFHHFMLRIVIRQNQTTKLIYFSVTILVFFTRGVFS